MFIRGGSSPRSNPLPFNISFFTKKVPLLLTNGTPFTYLVQNFVSPLIAECTVFQIAINHKNTKFSRLYKAIKFICYPFWVLSQTQMTDFRTLLYTSTSEILTPFGRSLPVQVPIGHRMEQPPGIVLQISSDMRIPGRETQHADHSSENKSGHYCFQSS